MTAFDVTNLAEMKVWAVGQGMIEVDAQLSPLEMLWLHTEWKSRIQAETDYYCTAAVGGEEA